MENARVIVPPSVEEKLDALKEIVKHPLLTMAGLGSVSAKIDTNYFLFGRVNQNGYSLEKIRDLQKDSLEGRGNPVCDEHIRLRKVYQTVSGVETIARGSSLFIRGHVADTREIDLDKELRNGGGKVKIYSLLDEWMVYGQTFEDVYAGVLMLGRENCNSGNNFLNEGFARLDIRDWSKR